MRPRRSAIGAGPPLPAPTTDADQAHRDLIDHGVAVIPDVLDSDQVEATRHQLTAIAQRERSDGTAVLDDGSSASGDYLSGANQRVLSLLTKGTIFWQLALAHQPLRAARRLLGANYGVTGTTGPGHALDDVLLSSITANIAALGGNPMELHADQGFVPPTTPYPVLVNAVWPLVDFTRHNGATRVVPGSHTTDPPTGTERRPAAVAVEARAGAVILLDGRTLHATGANRTSTPRPAVLAHYCHPWVRPFTNHCLDASPQLIATAPPELLDLLGCKRWFAHGTTEAAHRDRLLSHQP